MMQLICELAKHKPIYNLCCQAYATAQIDADPSVMTDVMGNHDILWHVHQLLEQGRRFPLQEKYPALEEVELPVPIEKEKAADHMLQLKKVIVKREGSKSIKDVPLLLKNAKLRFIFSSLAPIEVSDGDDDDEEEVVAKPSPKATALHAHMSGLLSKMGTPGSSSGVTTLVASPVMGGGKKRVADTDQNQNKKMRLDPKDFCVEFTPAMFKNTLVNIGILKKVSKDEWKDICESKKIPFTDKTKKDELKDEVVTAWATEFADEFNKKGSMFLN